VGSDTRLSGEQTILTGYGRIRTLQQGPDGALYFTTSNASPSGAAVDKIYRVTPS
jgi:quinoprotein glucose dehydrogenase